VAGPPLTDQQRADIIADIRETAGTTDGSVRRIAARHHVGMGTVQRVAQQNGLALAWRDGAWRTAEANAANAVHLSERRGQLQADLLDDVEELRERLLGDVIHLNVVRESIGPGASMERVEQTKLPAGPSDWRATMGAIASAVGRSVELARLDAETTGTGRVTTLIDEITDGLEEYRRIRDTAREAEHEAT
jgi:hypothetical protein